MAVSSKFVSGPTKGSSACVSTSLIVEGPVAVNELLIISLSCFF